MVLDYQSNLQYALAVITKNLEEKLDVVDTVPDQNTKVPRKRVKPKEPEFEDVELALDYYFNKISQLYRHNPQLTFEKMEDWYVSALFVKDHFSDKDFEKKQNELFQKEGR